MITIDVQPIRQTLLEAVDAAVTKIKREKRKEVTSLGVDLDFRFGRLWIAINDDDDESFRCPYFEYFKDREWGSATFDESTILADRLDGLDSDDEDDLQIRVVNGNEVEMLHALEDVCRWLFPKCIEWLTSWFNDQPVSRWRPIWLRIDEETVGQGESIRIAKDRKIPLSKKAKIEPPRIIGFTPPKHGAKVYKLGMNEREYVSLWSLDFDAAPRFVGQPLAGDYDEPIAVKADPPMVRRGDLTRYECGLAYLKSGRHADALIDYFSDPNFECIPLFDGEQKWTAVHPLNPDSVLDQSRTEYDWNHSKNAWDGVRLCEFDPTALRNMGRHVFKIQESPFHGPFFFEDEGCPGFLALCEKLGLRGVKFELIWCEDVSEIVPKFEEFMDLLNFRLKRKAGSPPVEEYLDVHCISGLHKNFWRIGVFRQLLGKHGAREALRRVPGVSVFIRSLMPLAPFQSPASSKPLAPQVIEEIDRRFEGREILDEIKGRLCIDLPKALASLKEMEAEDSRG